MPDIFFGKLDEVPDGLREYAKEQDGKVIVKVVPQSKLDEFRDNNLKLSQERDTLKTKFDSVSGLVGDDLEAFKAELEELKTTKQRVNDGKLKASDDIEKEVANRVSSMKQDYERQQSALANEVKAWKDKATQADLKFKQSIIDNAITAAVVNGKSGAEVSALVDIKNRAKAIFTVDDNGKLIPKDGEAIIYGSDGATPMTPEEWLGKLKTEAPYFFKQSNGGGAGGNTGGGKIPNGMTQEQWDKLPGATKLKLARGAGL